MAASCRGPACTPPPPPTHTHMQHTCVALPKFVVVVWLQQARVRAGEGVRVHELIKHHVRDAGLHLQGAGAGGGAIPGGGGCGGGCPGALPGAGSASQDERGGVCSSGDQQPPALPLALPAGLPCLQRAGQAVQGLVGGCGAVARTEVANVSSAPGTPLPTMAPL